MVLIITCKKWKDMTEDEKLDDLRFTMLMLSVDVIICCVALIGIIAGWF
jgi:hypothetical protein